MAFAAVGRGMARDDKDKDAYVEMVLQSDVYPKPVVEQLQSNVYEVRTSEDIREVVSQLLSGSGDVESSDATGEETAYGLRFLAEAAMNVSDNFEDSKILEVHSNEELPMITLLEFSEYLNNQPSETIKGIYAKSVELLQNPNAIVPAPGCDVKAQMLESRRLKESPHLVTPGEGQEYIVREELPSLQWYSHMFSCSCNAPVK